MGTEKIPEKREQGGSELVYIGYSEECFFA